MNELMNDGGWKSIETAPHNGDSVQLKLQDGLIVNRAQWEAFHQNWCKPEFDKNGSVIGLQRLETPKAWSQFPR